MTGDGPVVHEVDIDAPVEIVFSMFTDPERLAAWLGTSADLDPRPGGRFRFEVNPGEVCAGEYLEVAPPHRVVFTWGWESPEIPLPPGSSTVEVDLTPVGDSTHLRLAHHGLEGDVRFLHDDGWQYFLGRLGVAATGGDPGPMTGRRPADVLDDRERTAE